MLQKKNYSEDAKNFFFDEMNKKKKNQLKEKYGMDFSEEKENVPPEVINGSLNYVEEFEEVWKNAGRKKIIEIIGFPKFKKLNELTPDKLECEISEVLSIYAQHDINIDIIELDEVIDEEFYKFLTEELPEHETDFMRVEGMTINYIYEEFHSGDKLDAKNIIEWFSYPYFERNEKEIKIYLSKRNLTFNGVKKSPSQFVDEMFKLISGYGKILKFRSVFKEFNFNLNEKIDGRVHVEFILTHKAVQTAEASHLKKRKQKRSTLNLIFDLERSKYGGFKIKGCSVEKITA
jgi:sugar-specific transcriptional regulator TrmB